MDLILLSLGSNVGDREQNLAQARQLLEEQGIAILKASPIYETEPVGYADQDSFLNQVVAVKTQRAPYTLLNICQKIEKKLRRQRNVPNGPRTIDVDLLYYYNRIIEEKDLELPHPGIPQRRFVLQPLADVAGSEQDPTLERSLQQVLDSCTDPHTVELYQS